MTELVTSYSQKTYGIDLDGVCFDFMNPFRMWLNDKLSINIGPHEIKSYYWHEGRDDLTKEDFFREFDKFGMGGHGYRHLNLLPMALEGLKRIHAEGHKIYYITNRPLYTQQDTIDCLEEHGFPQRENLYFAQGSKVPLVKELNVDVFIDDSPKTVEELTTQTRASVYCRSYPFNEHLDDTFLTRVNGWDEFLVAEGFSSVAR